MKYIYNYIEHSLNESFNSKEAKKKFLDTKLISKKDYTIIKKAFLPKYVYWGCRERANPENKNVILDSIYDVTLWFEKNKQYLKSKDLYSYIYDEIRLLMNDPSIGPKKKKTKGQGDYEIVYEDSNITIVHVKDHAASVYWAHKYREGEIADGQWCTAAYNDDSNFENYSAEGPILIYILPNEKGSDQRCCSVTQSASYYIEDKRENRFITDNTSNIVTNFSFYSAIDTLLSDEYSNIIKKTYNIDKILQKHFKYENSLDMAIKDISKIELGDLIKVYLEYLNYDFNYMYSNGPFRDNIVKYIEKNYRFIDKDLDIHYIDDNYILEVIKTINSYIKDGFKYIYDVAGMEFYEGTGKYRLILFSKTKLTNKYKFNINSDMEVDSLGQELSDIDLSRFDMITVEEYVDYIS